VVLRSNHVRDAGRLPSLLQRRPHVHVPKGMYPLRVPLLILQQVDSESLSCWMLLELTIPVRLHALFGQRLWSEWLGTAFLRNSSSIAEKMSEQTSPGCKVTSMFGTSKIRTQRAEFLQQQRERFETKFCVLVGVSDWNLQDFYSQTCRAL
jgi:hypothetical protein